MSRTFITSDTHFHHYNLVKGTSKWDNTDNCRQFSTIEEHDNYILDNLNSLIQPDDTLYHLGDFTLGSKDKLKAYNDYRDRIRCKNIFYIRGNHSSSLKDLNQTNIFNLVTDYNECKYKSNFIVMFHYPLMSWHNMSKNSYMLFGHCHHQNYEDSIRGRSMDIGLDGNNFKPWLLDDVIDILKSQPILTEGHHV